MSWISRIPCKGLACKILLGCSIAILIPWLFFFFLLKHHDRKWMEDELLSQARAIYNLLTTTRQWISLHGGIYLWNGEDYTLVTPSHFIKDLSTFSEKKLFYKIKIAVENPKNPAHRPDAFEREAIALLKQGKQEVWKIDPEKHLYRYAAPLTFEEECLSCHRWPLQKAIVGCLSLSLPIQNLQEKIAKRRKLINIYFIVIFIFMFFSLSLLIRRMVLDPLKRFKLTTQKIKDGHYLPVEIRSGDEWRDLAETFNGMVHQIRHHQEELERKIQEATEKLRKAYEELRKTDQFKSEFFSNITHDLKTPLSAIKGTIDYLLRKDPENQHLKIAQKNVQKLLQMINTILDITRLEHGQLELNRELCDLRELVEEACLSHEPLAWEKEIEIRQHIPSEPIWVEIDPERMYGVISNLLDNAIKFSPRNSRVEVRLFREDHRAFLEVEDYGPGIKPEERSKIFQKFYHTHSGGLGLGLAISYGIIKAHKGEIWVRSPEGHQGTIFVVALPLKNG